MFLLLNIINIIIISIITGLATTPKFASAVIPKSNVNSLKL